MNNLIIKIDKSTLQKIFLAIRNSFKQSNTYKQILQLHLSPNTGVRGGARYICSECGTELTLKELEVHHDPSVTPYDKYWYEMSVEEYYTAVFSNPATVVCRPCHELISKEQKLQRRKSKIAKNHKDK